MGNSESRTHTLVKVDVEGAELEVLDGASSWLNPTNYFLVEIHEESFLARMVQLFAAHGLRSLPLLGREMRSEKNWWLVSEL
jgi:hypothetical protein